MRREKQRQEIIRKQAEKAGVRTQPPAAAKPSTRGFDKKGREIAPEDEEDLDVDAPRVQARPAPKPTPAINKKAAAPVPASLPLPEPERMAANERKKNGFTLPPLSLLDASRGERKIDERELRSIHMQGYVSAIKAGVGTIMPSYNSWNGVKCSGANDC